MFLQVDRPMERRAATRRPRRAPVRIAFDVDDWSSDADTFWLDSCDLSEEGAFLETDLLFSLGEQLQLEIPVDGRARPVRGRARVVRVVSTRHVPGPGVAVAFEDLDREQRRALARK